MTHRILVVDDEAASRKGLGALLSAWGYDVEEAADGQEALDKAVASSPAVVITDLVMPRLDGLGLLRALQAEVPFATVIILTGHGSIESAPRAARLRVLRRRRREGPGRHGPHPRPRVHQDAAVADQLLGQARRPGPADLRRGPRGEEPAERHDGPPRAAAGAACGLAGGGEREPGGDRRRDPPPGPGGPGVPQVHPRCGAPPCRLLRRHPPPHPRGLRPLLRPRPRSRSPRRYSRPRCQARRRCA